MARTLSSRLAERRTALATALRIWSGAVCLIATSMAIGAAPINPTGRTLELQVPLSLNGQPLGSLLLRIETDDAMSLDAAGLGALLAERLTPVALAAIDAAAIDGRVTPDALDAAGMLTTFDSAALSLEASVPSAALRRRSLSLGRERVVDTAGRARPEPFSAFFNLGLAAVRDEREEGTFGRRAETTYRLDVDGLARLGGPVLAYEGVQVAGPDGVTRASRRATALLLDLQSREARVTLGDQRYLGRGLQRSLALLGIGLGRHFALSGGSVRVRGRRAIELERASRVEVRVRERLLGTFDLAPGSYDFEDIPLAAGANDVELRIVDDVGRVDVLEFTELYDSALLPEGRYDYALGLGVRARTTDAEPEYVEEAPLASGYLRRGFAGGFTLGANLEASEEAYRVGAEWLRATRLGPLDLLAGLSSGAERRTGFALGAAFSTLNGAGSFLRAGRLDLRAVARSRAFIDAGDTLEDTDSAIVPLEGTVGGDGTELTLSLGYGASLDDGLAVGLGTTLVREEGDVDIGTSFALSGRWRALPRLGWAVRTRYVTREAEADSHDLQLSLSWQIERDARVALGHSADDAITTLDYRRGDGGAAVGSYGVGVGLVRETDERTELDFDAARAFNRFDVFASYRGSRTALEDEEGFGDSPLRGEEEASSALVRIDTAVGIAGGAIAIGRRVDEGFAVVRAHPALAPRPVLLDAYEGRYAARTGALGPALVSAPSPYRAASIRYEVEDLPLGFDIGSGAFDVRAPLGAGYRLEVGSAARITVVGTLLDGETGEPLGLVSGNALPADGTATEPVRFFSNRSGKFAIPGLLPGEYDIVLDTLPERRARLGIPEEADSLHRVPDFAIP